MRVKRVVLIVAIALACVAPAPARAWPWSSKLEQHQTPPEPGKIDLPTPSDVAVDVDAGVETSNATELSQLIPAFRARSLSCVTCHRMLAFFDEYLLSALLDINAAESRKTTTSAFRTNYGALETTIEEAVSSVCGAQSIATNHTMRKSCAKMIERAEDDVVALYFEHGAAMRRGDDERELGEPLCGVRGVLKAGCEDSMARLTVSELMTLEEEAQFVSKDDTHPMLRAPKTETKYKSEPESAETKSGEVQKIVASDFYKRVIIDRGRDALVYFAYPSLAPEFHHAYAQTHALVAEFMEDSNLLVGMLNVELNDVPPPYNNWAQTPNVMLYLANRKENPRFIPLRTAPGETMTGESAPTLADVLTMISKRTEDKKTKKAADWGMIDATAEQLYANRAKESKDEL